ncbi:hypothetical protein JCM3770_007037 [Rhodotorula araucariae]
MSYAPVQSNASFLENQQLLQTSNRSKTQERIIHPSFLQPGTANPAYTRFSTVSYVGFCNKLYTKGGNFDHIILSWPIFFVRDPMLQRNPRNFMINYNAWFELCIAPSYAGLVLLSDHGTPVGWRHTHMSGFGCHAFRFLNKEGGCVFIKLHRVPGSSDKERCRELERIRNPKDYHRDVEQACFSPGSLVPGIEPSPDSLLNWHMFFYRDAQYNRMGLANLHQIPVNCPFMAKVHSPDNYAGSMRIDGNTLGKPVYFPTCSTLRRHDRHDPVVRPGDRRDAGGV